MKFLIKKIYKRIKYEIKNIKSHIPLKIQILSKATNVGRSSRFEYQKKYIKFDIQKDDKVLDIGSGHIPFPLATHLADNFDDGTQHRDGVLVIDKRPFTKCNVESTPFRDKEFDFVYCSHVLEHTQSPGRACEELMRISKRGYIETPTRLSDTFFNITAIKNHHRWHVEMLGNTLIFLEYDKRTLRDTQVNYFFHQFHSQWQNPTKILVDKNQDIFVNMFLWKSNFNYIVINKEGKINSTNL